MDGEHRARVQALLSQAAAEHRALLERLPPGLRESLPVDAQGLTAAIEHVAVSAGLSAAERRALIRPHGTNSAVLHARVFGPAPLARGTVIGAFVDGARVRAEALTKLAEAIGGGGLGEEIRRLLSEHPPPAAPEEDGAVVSLRDTYAAQERAAIVLAAALDAR